MKKLIALVALALSFSTPLMAAENKEIESITVLADSKLAVPLSQIASNFTHQNLGEKTMIGVATVFGNAEAQKKKIEDGESADIFITSDAYLIDNLKIKGLVDIYSIGEVASNGTTHYTAAVVASENMTPARKFLAYIKSDNARKIFKNNDMTTPEPDDSAQ